MTAIPDTANHQWEKPDVAEGGKRGGYGTFLGVFVPSILMVFGVIIFLRMGWIVGQAGMYTAFLLISFSTLIALLTTLSMASISTNIEVGKGGVYYLLSRSLGIEVGSAIGVPLYFKQCLSIAFCVIGFAESLHDLVPLWSITHIGLGTLFTLTLLAYFSLSGALKVQVGIFIAIIASLASLFLGGSEMLEGRVVAPTDINFQPIGFFTLFAIFFPAMTGIESSVSLSGELRNPGKSLPLGTIAALLVAYAIYMVISWFLISNISVGLLISDPFIIQAVSKVPALIILGIWGCTISSALGGLLGAPRTLQALAEDGVVPRIFGKNFGKMQEPRIATLTTCIIALFSIYYGSVDLIAPLMTMICLICYGVLNFSAGLETLMANPSWRPRFRIHWSLSFLGGLLCLIAMVMIDSGSALIASAFVSLLYFVAQRRKHESSWNDIRDGILIFFSRYAVSRLALSETATKSWRPHFLVFAKENDGSLVQFSQAVNQEKGFVTMASFVPNPVSEIEKKEIQKSLQAKLRAEGVQAFVEVGYSEKLYLSMNQMIETYGLGPLKPNTVICGIHNDDDLENFACVINKANQRHCNMVILNSRNDSLASRLAAGDLHLWWHPCHKENGDFMLVLAYMLTRNSLWKKSKVCLKVLVDSEFKKQETLEHFQELSRVRRLPVQIEILVAANPVDDYLKYVSKYSEGAGLVFLSLAPPSSAEASEEYQDYLKSMVNFSQEFPSVALVMSSEFTPFKDILS